MSLDDAELEAWIKQGPLSNSQKIARDVRRVYTAFREVGFSEAEAFDLGRDYFNVMLDVVRPDDDPDEDET